MPSQILRLGHCITLSICTNISNIRDISTNQEMVAQNIEMTLINRRNSHFDTKQASGI